MSFEIEGKLHKVYPTEQKSASFQAREFGIEIMSGNYPQYIKFQLTQEKCSIIDGYNEGDIIKVYFDLRGREWQDKIFTNLNAWRVEGASQVASGNSGGGTTATVKTTSDAPVYNDDAFAGLSSEPIMPVNDDLPF
jgi:single-strand DNA-binding protein